MYQLATAPRGIGQVLDSVFKLTGAAWMRMLPYALLSMVLGALPIVYVMAAGVLDDPAQMATLGFSGGYWLMVAVMMFVGLYLSGAGVARIESIAQEADIGFGASLRVALSKVLPLSIGFIGFTLAVAVGTVLLVVPGIILLGSLFLFLPAIVLDGKGAIESLNYSHKLVWGNWWRVAAIGAIAIVILYIVYLLLGLLIAMFVGFGGLIDPATVFIVNIVTSMVGSLVITAFFYALYVELYREVKMRKTGGDLAARIAAVGTGR